MDSILGLFDKLILLFIIAIFARAILSFVLPMTGMRSNPLLTSVNTLINQITDPILVPLRRVLPRFGMFDLSPMVAIIVLYIIRDVLARSS